MTLQTRASNRRRRLSATRRSLLHIAQTEQAVASLAPELWQQVTPPLVRWLRATLREVRPQLEALVVETRALSPEALYLQSLLETYRFEDVPLERLEPIVEDLTTRALLAYGWLPEDPRTEVLERELREMVEGDLFAFWRSRTDPALLARRITKLRGEGLGVEAMSGVLAQRYRADFYSAERLIRTTYTSGANRAHVADLEAQGYTHKRFLTAKDSRVRGGRGSQYNHRQMDGQTVPLDEPFVTPEGYRLMYPGDRSLGAPAGTIVNCRCSLIGTRKA